jgi:hypothetical protein
VGRSLKPYLITLAVVLMATGAAASDFVHFASWSGGLARILFVVVPAVLVVGTVIGLAARRRA